MLHLLDFLIGYWRRSEVLLQKSGYLESYNEWIQMMFIK